MSTVAIIYYPLPDSVQELCDALMDREQELREGRIIINNASEPAEALRCLKLDRDHRYVVTFGPLSINVVDR